MERLTEKCWRNLDPWECCGQDHFCNRGCHDKGGCTNGCIVPKLYAKLAKYENLEEKGLLVKLPNDLSEDKLYGVFTHFNRETGKMEYSFVEMEK